MRRILMLGVLVPMTLSAYRYETVLLETQAKLTPRLMLMSKGVAYESPNRLSVCVLFEPEEKHVADIYKKTLLNYYPNGWEYHSIAVEESRFTLMEDHCADSEMLYLLKSSESNIRRAVSYATLQRKLTMSYDSRYLEFGVLLSLYVGRNLRPYLNLEQAKKAGIRFDNDLKRISKLLKVQEAVQ